MSSNLKGRVIALAKRQHRRGACDAPAEITVRGGLPVLDADRQIINAPTACCYDYGGENAEHYRADPGEDVAAFQARVRASTDRGFILWRGLENSCTFHPLLSPIPASVGLLKNRADHFATEE
jgi:hypothetical protein